MFYNNTNTKLRKSIPKIGILLSLILQLYSFRTQNYNIQILSITVLLVSTWLDLPKGSILPKTFLLMFQVFLINMPLIDIFRKKAWWQNNYNLASLPQSLMMIYISLVFLLIGFNVFLQENNKCIKSGTLSNHFSLISKNINNRIENFLEQNKIPKKNIYFLVFTLYIITFGCSLYAEADKLLFMSGKTYEDFYKLYSITYPPIISIIGNLNTYFMIFILALLPKKKLSFTILTLNIVKTIPLLIIGKRGPFMLAGLFAVVYYLLRDSLKDNEKWFGKKEKITLILALPLLLSLMTLINYSRSGFETHGIKIFDYSVDFFYRQGFTFKVFTLGIEKFGDIQSFSPGKNFIFGEIIDLFKFGRLSQIIFSAPSLPLGNSEFAAIHSSSYAHSLAYIAHPQYLQGHGYGSSYILEGFQTYGIIGIAMVNLVVAFILTKSRKLFMDNFLSRFIALIFIEKIFFLPRASFSSLFSVFLKPSFILFVLTIVGFLFVNKYYNKYSKNQ